MTEEMIAQAREAQSAEELLRLAKDNGLEEFTGEDAEDLYAQMHASGEMSDEEMENVSGGGCITKVNGKKYTMVTCGRTCFTGKWEAGFERDAIGNKVCKREDNTTQRKMWNEKLNSGDNQCGTCYHLGFKSGTGYCEVEFD